MKKILLTGVVGALGVTGAFAQGSIDALTSIFSADQIVLPGADATNPNNFNQTYFSGNVTIALYYAASSSATAAQVSSINAFDGLAGGGTSALAALTADGFSEVSVPGNNGAGTTVGAGSYTVTSGTITSGPDTVGIYGSGVTANGSGWLALVVTGTGAYSAYSGVLVWDQPNLGGDPNAPTPGTPADVVQDPAGVNLVLTTSVPEPGTIALACLGGASLLMFRRKK
jgi:hypothetical protein